MFVKKKSGEIRLCVDYGELSERTVKDAYPLLYRVRFKINFLALLFFQPLTSKIGFDRFQLAQMTVRTAFCPSPGIGLFLFPTIPFGLNGTPSTFQRLMNTIFQGIPFVTTYLDDILTHSANEKGTRMQQVLEQYEQLA